MTMLRDLTPLARWDGLHLVLDLPAVEAWLRRLLENVESLSDPRLEGSGDVIRLEVTVRAKGLTSRVEVELGEVRVRLRRLGVRIGRVRVMRGVRVPRSLVESALERAAPEVITVVRGSGIAVVDLRRWIPSEVDLKIVALQVMGDRLHLWFGPGSMAAWPTPQRPVLAADNRKERLLPEGA